MDHLTAHTIVKLMRKHGKTIHGLAAAMNINMTRVRHVRARGITGEAFVQDWMQAITGDHKAEWAAVAHAHACA